MKQLLTTFAVIVFALLIYTCEQTAESEATVDQVGFFYADHDTFYYDDYGYERISQPNTEGYGVLFGDPLPGFEAFKMGSSTYSGPEYHDYSPGYVAFGNFGSGADARITNNLDPLAVEIRTSEGTLKGTVDLPGLIQSIALSETESIALGQPFSISWSGGDADFYDVYCDYEFHENGIWQYENIGGFVRGSSLTIPGTVLAYNGMIDYIRIEPMVGPLPVEGARGNMTGTGSGYLYYMRESFRYMGGDIMVGSGPLSKPPPGDEELSHSRADFRADMRNRIQTEILGEI